MALVKKAEAVAPNSGAAISSVPSGTLMERIRSFDHISDRSERAYEIAQIEPANEEETRILNDEFWEALMG